MEINNSFSDKIQLKNLNSLFGIDQEEIGKVIEVPLEELFPFSRHPFKVIDDEKMSQLVESVRENGILVPIMVRTRKEGGYEVISGHRRRHAAEIAGLEKVPVIIRDLSDDEAVIAMVDANLQREEILPSEKAFAYKMKMEAISHQGRRGYTTRVGWRAESASLVGEAAGESKNQVRRYIRLTYLLPDLLKMVDAGKFKLNAAVEISYICSSEQYVLFEMMRDEGIVPSLQQAQQIKKLSQDKAFTRNALYALLTSKEVKERTVVLKNDVLRRFFPEETGDREIEALIVRLLEEYRGKQKNSRSLPADPSEEEEED